MNDLRGARPDLALQSTPSLLAPIATLLGDQAGRAVISTGTLRSVLESVGMRLDEMRDVSRYLTGLLVFLGLARNPDVVFTESATDDQARPGKPTPLPH